MKNRNFKGFAHQGLLLLLVVVAVIAAVAYRVSIHNRNSSSSVTSASTAATTAPTKYRSKTDIEQASKSLDNDPGDSQLDPSQLDAALNQLL